LLSVATRLRMPRDFGVRERRVELDGEAYFVIQHDALRPFVVRTRYGTAEDLGTEFDVHAYGPEDGVAVVVASGRVGLRAPDGADRRALARVLAARFTRTGRAVRLLPVVHDRRRT